MGAPEIDRKLGITVYATKTAGIGGVIRGHAEDFVVEEILTNGAKASVAPSELSSRLGRHLVCLLVKRNWDTLLAVRAVTNRLGINSERISIAGIKDKKALTAQHISLYGVRPEKISRLKIRNMGVYPVRYADEGISTKFLFGNQFTIVIRSIILEKNKVEELVDATRSELLDFGGAPNFFGHQRFGTARPVTHLVGEALVKSDLEDAELVFLAFSNEYEHPVVKKARERLTETRNFKEALADFPARFRYERLMLGHLVGYPKDFLGAFRKLPRKLRLLFVQAYQSFLFNQFLSERIRQGIGLDEVHVGDYVVPLDEHGLPANLGESATEKTLSKLNKAVKEGNACVAIPLIGFKQSPSSGVQGEIEQKILEKENIKPEDFTFSEVPEVSAPGGLRAVLTPLIDFAAEKPVEDSLNSAASAVRLRFALRKSSYATVPLREFMKPRNPIESGF